MSQESTSRPSIRCSTGSFGAEEMLKSVERVQETRCEIYDARRMFEGDILIWCCILGQSQESAAVMHSIVSTKQLLRCKWKIQICRTLMTFIAHIHFALAQIVPTSSTMTV
jgi:hypothetical protein